MTFNQDYKFLNLQLPLDEIFIFPDCKLKTRQILNFPYNS